MQHVVPPRAPLGPTSSSAGLLRRTPQFRRRVAASSSVAIPQVRLLVLPLRQLCGQALAVACMHAWQAMQPHMPPSP